MLRNNQNQSQVANAIKVFYHLKTLEQKLDTTLTALNAKISQTTKNVLSEDVQREGTLPHLPFSPGKPGSVSGQNG
jgi:hypothetical protein